LASPDGWSSCGAGRSQPLAITGKIRVAQNRGNTRNPLPRIASGCGATSMVRRRSIWPLCSGFGRSLPCEGGGRSPGFAQDACVTGRREN
jgi:hypothetical protein